MEAVGGRRAVVKVRFLRQPRCTMGSLASMRRKTWRVRCDDGIVSFLQSAIHGEVLLSHRPCTRHLMYVDVQ